MQGNVVDFDRKILICDPLQYTSSTKLRKIALMCIASHCEDKDIYEARESFISLDIEGKGRININQLKAMLNNYSTINSQILNNYIEAMDLNHNGYIEYTEYISSVIKSEVFLNNQKILHSFFLLDINKNGRISVDDLQHLLSINNDNISICQEILFEVNCSEINGLTMENYTQIIQLNRLIN